MDSEVAIKDGKSEPASYMLRKWRTGLEKFCGQNLERLLMRPQCSLFHLRTGDGSQVLPEDDVTSQRPEVKGEAALTLSRSEERSFELVHMHVGREKVEQTGKMGEESRSKHLLNTFYVLDTFYMLSMQFFQGLCD